MVFIYKLSTLSILYVFLTLESVRGLPLTSYSDKGKEIHLSSRDEYGDLCNVRMELGKLERTVATALARLNRLQKCKCSMFLDKVEWKKCICEGLSIYYLLAAKFFSEGKIYTNSWQLRDFVYNQRDPAFRFHFVLR